MKQAYNDDEVFIHKLRAGKPGKKVWEILEYCRSERAYVLRSVDDISDYSYLKGSVLVEIAEY